MSAIDSVVKRKLRKGAKYDMAFVQIAARLIAAGMTVKDVGYALGVKPATVKQWKARYDEFKAATNSKSEAKQIAGAHLVANGLQSAMGYDYEEVDQVLVRKENPDYDKDVEGSEETILVVIKETRKAKHRPPDKDLLQFFLLNISDEYKNQKTLRIEETKKSINLNITGHLESTDIRKLAGAAFKTADKMDKETKRIESKVIDVVEGETCDVKRMPPATVSDTRIDSKLNDKFLESIGDDE